MPIFITFHMLELEHVAGKSTFVKGRQVCVNVNNITHFITAATKQHPENQGTFISFVGEDDNNGTIRVSATYEEVEILIASTIDYIHQLRARQF